MYIFTHSCILTSILVYYTFLILHIFKKNFKALFLFHRDNREFMYAISSPDTVEFGYAINEKTLD